MFLIVQIDKKVIFFLFHVLFLYGIIIGMTELVRPSMKLANVKVTDADMIYFSLGLDKEPFILPSQRKDYRSDPKAVALVQAVKAGKDLSGQDFSGLNLIGADISGGKFKGANFSKAIFYKTTAKKCHFEGADFTEAYWESSWFEDSDFRGAKLTQLYARGNDFTNSKLDPEAVNRLNSLDRLIKLLESGEIDIRSLSQEDLLCLDLRRIDLSKIDLEDIDLSIFILEGVNLRGTYIDPKQLLSLEGWVQYWLDVQKLKEKRIKAENARFFKEHQEMMKAFSRRQMEQIEQNKNLKTPKETLRRPSLKEDEFKREEKVRTVVSWTPNEKPLENAVLPTVKESQTRPVPKLVVSRSVSENTEEEWSLSKSDLKQNEAEKIVQSQEPSFEQILLTEKGEDKISNLQEDIVLDKTHNLSHNSIDRDEEVEFEHDNQQTEMCQDEDNTPHKVSGQFYKARKSKSKQQG